MKNLTLSFAVVALILCTCTTVFAQDEDRFSAAMSKMLEMLESAENPEDWQRAANSFERISNAEPDQWLAAYYAGYCNTMLAFMPLEGTDVDAVLDKADEQLEKAAAIAGENPEILVAMSMSASGRMQVDPSDQGRMMTYGPKSGMLANKAREIDPENPRAWLQVGQNTFYTPEQFGGGKEKGCKILMVAKEKYSTFEPESALHPNWGKEYLEVVLERGCTGDGHDHDHEHHEGDGHNH